MDTLFFIASKAAWLLLRPESLLVLLAVLSWLLLLRGKARPAVRMLSTALLLALLIGIVPIGTFLLRPLEQAYARIPPQGPVAGIVILGGAEAQAPRFAGSIPQVNEGAERLIAGMVLARAYPEAVVIYSGGRASLTPAAAGAFEPGPDLLRQLGLPEDRLIVEGQSRTTAENAVRAVALKPDIPGIWLLVTSAFHMPRAFATFCAAGWRDLHPYPTDYRSADLPDGIGWDLALNLQDLNIAAKEWIGLAAYRATGRIKNLFPERCA